MDGVDAIFGGWREEHTGQLWKLLAPQTLRAAPDAPRSCSSFAKSSLTSSRPSGRLQPVRPEKARRVGDALARRDARCDNPFSCINVMLYSSTT